MLLYAENNYGCIPGYFHWFDVLILISGFYMHYIADCFVIKQLCGLVNTITALEFVTTTYHKLRSKIVHWIFYFFLFIMPLSGFTVTFFSGRKIYLFDMDITNTCLSKNIFVGKLVYVIAYTLVYMASLHIIVVCYHHFILRDNVVVRMCALWSFRKKEKYL